MGKTFTLGTYPNVGISSSGTPTTNYLPKFTGASTIGNSLIYDNGSSLGISTTTLVDKLTINGGIALTQTGAEYIYSNGGTGTAVNAGFYFDGTNNAVRLYTNNTEKMRVTSSGNVGIGTSSPSALLHVAGSAPYIHIQPTSGSRYIDIGNWDASTNFMEAGGGGLYIKTQQAYDLLFGTNTAERMRITNEVGTANVCIGTTSSPQANSGRGALTINGSSTTILTMAIGGAEKGYVYHNASEINLVNSTPGRLYCIAYTGGVYLNSGATSWTANSDERLKDITGNIDNAVDSLMSLRAVKHTWKADADKVEKLALIAQDVEKVFPQVIDKGKLPSKPDEEQTDETEYLGVRYTELIPVLVKAIQELSAKVTALENK